MSVEDYYNVDERAVNEYLKDTKVLTIAAAWIMRDTTKGNQTDAELRSVKALVDRIQPLRLSKVVLYRGFTVGGMNSDHGVGDTPRRPGDILELDISLPTSFTSEIEVANAFGKCVVSAVFASELKDTLRIPQELAVAVQRHFSFPFPNMHEWVYLKSGSKLTARVVSFKSGSWYKFWK